MNRLFILVIILLTLSSSIFYQKYYTGQRVFSEKFPKEIFDYNQDTYIKINNAKGDIIVAIENISSNRVIQHSYIVSYDTYSFKNIPVGIYVAKYMWTDPNGRRRYEKDNSTMQFKVDEYGGYEITLKETPLGNLSQSSISESDFFNN